MCMRSWIILSTLKINAMPVHISMDTSGYARSECVYGKNNCRKYARGGRTNYQGIGNITIQWTHKTTAAAVYDDDDNEGRG